MTPEEQGLLDRLRLALDASPLSAAEVARRIGTKASTISGWFSEGKLPGGALLVRLPSVLGVDGHWLLTGEEGAFPAAVEAMRLVRAMRALLEPVAGKSDEPHVIELTPEDFELIPDTRSDEEKSRAKGQAGSKKSSSP